MMTYIHPYTHTHTHTHTNTHTHKTYRNTYMYACIHPYIRTHTNIQVNGTHWGEAAAAAQAFAAAHFRPGNLEQEVRGLLAPLER